MEFLMQRILKFPHGKAILYNYRLIQSATGEGPQVSSCKSMILGKEEKEGTKGPVKYAGKTNVKEYIVLQIKK